MECSLKLVCRLFIADKKEVSEVRFEECYRLIYSYTIKANDTSLRNFLKNILLNLEYINIDDITDEKIQRVKDILMYYLHHCHIFNFDKLISNKLNEIKEKKIYSKIL